MQRKIIGVICLVVGVMLLFWGHNISQAFGSQITHAFTGETPDKAMWLYVGGTILCAMGALAIFMSGGRKSGS